MKSAADMTHEELIDIVSDIQDILWPEGDPDVDWDSDTLDYVANTLHYAGLGADK